MRQDISTRSIIIILNSAITIYVLKSHFVLICTVLNGNFSYKLFENQTANDS